MTYPWTYRLPTVACYCYGYGYVYTIAYTCNTLRLPSNHQSLPISQMLSITTTSICSPTKRNNQQRQQRAPKHTGSQAPPSPQYAPLPSKQKAAPMKLLSLSLVSVCQCQSPESPESRN